MRLVCKPFAGTVRRMIVGRYVNCQRERRDRVAIRMEAIVKKDTILGYVMTYVNTKVQYVGSTEYFTSWYG